MGGVLAILTTTSPIWVCVFYVAKVELAILITPEYLMEPLACCSI